MGAGQLWSTPMVYTTIINQYLISGLARGFERDARMAVYTATALSTSEATQLAYEDRPTLDPTAFHGLNHMTTFFIQHYQWNDWQQLAPHWLEDYIDSRLREGIAPGTINWDLIYFRALCLFLVDEGQDVPKAILKLKVLDTPRCLPRPLSSEQVHRLERGIKAAVVEVITIPT